MTATDVFEVEIRRTYGEWPTVAVASVTVAASVRVAGFRILSDAAGELSVQSPPLAGSPIVDPVPLTDAVLEAAHDLLSPYR